VSGIPGFVTLEHRLRRNLTNDEIPSLSQHGPSGYRRTVVQSPPSAGAIPADDYAAAGAERFQQTLL
jgi:hypothetical protein